MDWAQHLVDQLEWHWTNQFLPRLTGLDDHEYLWEPVPDMWSVRPSGSGYAIDWDPNPPTPPPVTTIAWRLGHLVGVFAYRAANHFDGPPFDPNTHPYSGTAEGALTQLDEAYTHWITGVRGLAEADLAKPCGPAEGAHAEYPLATLVLHINREAIHHGAEVALLRDLYAHR
ncbi:DinB family protein [Actinokineospora auranticolor]|uniref:DinB family protein n=1 Tax=Actinokineospora auranticolor TaxID=155976 RepID=A0A2S6GRX0_9PSEU|nr:DinB family protein [Actinokineospora auranticolor]PPK67988.1 DinB family protein [Actinokineospora auranticolor]